MPGEANLIYSHPVLSKGIYSLIHCGIEWNPDRFPANRIKSYRKRTSDKDADVSVEDVVFSDLEGLVYSTTNTDDKNAVLTSVYYFVYQINDSANLVIYNTQRVAQDSERVDNKFIFLNYCEDFVRRNKATIDAWNPRLGIPGSPGMTKIGNDTLYFLIPDCWRQFQKNDLNDTNNVSGKCFTLLRNNDRSCQPATISLNSYDFNAGSDKPQKFLHYDYNRENYVIVSAFNTRYEDGTIQDTTIGDCKLKITTGALIEKVNTCPLPYLAYERYYSVKIIDDDHNLILVLYLRASCTDSFDLQYWDDYFQVYFDDFLSKNDFTGW